MKTAAEASDFLLRKFPVIRSVLDKLEQGSTKFTGTISELQIEYGLRTTGLFSEVSGSLGDRGFSLKNTSDNGIDIIAKAKYGSYANKWYAYEVKASTTGQFGSLSSDQAKGAAWFVKDRLQKMESGTAPYTTGRILDNDRVSASRVLDEQGKNTDFKGDVVWIRNFGTPKVQVLLRPWLQGMTPTRK